MTPMTMMTKGKRTNGVPKMIAQRWIRTHHRVRRMTEILVIEGDEDAMTPAVDALKKKRLAFTLHSYEHVTGSQGYGLEASEKLGLSPDKVFKTLLVTDGAGKFATAIVPVAGMLNLKRAAKSLGWKKAAMANGDDAQRITGYVLGGISPLG